MTKITIYMEMASGPCDLMHLHFSRTVINIIIRSVPMASKNLYIIFFEQCHHTFEIPKVCAVIRS